MLGEKQAESIYKQLEIALYDCKTREQLEDELQDSIQYIQYESHMLLLT